MKRIERGKELEAILNLKGNCYCAFQAPDTGEWLKYRIYRATPRGDRPQTWTCNPLWYIQAETKPEKWTLIGSWMMGGTGSMLFNENHMNAWAKGFDWFSHSLRMGDLPKSFRLYELEGPDDHT